MQSLNKPAGTNLHSQALVDDGDGSGLKPTRIPVVRKLVNGAVLASARVEIWEPLEEIYFTT